MIGKTDGWMADERMNDWKVEWIEKWTNERRHTWVT